MRALVLTSALLLPTTSVAAKPPSCSVRIGEMVPNAHVARAVAEAMISGRQTPERMASYVLHVEPDERNPGKWIVWQGLPDPPPSKNGIIYLQAGGGGIEMKIDKCTGQISDAHYSR